jgi:DNA helicase-4
LPRLGVKTRVTLITIQHIASPFIAELVREHKAEVSNLDGSAAGEEVCPECHEGFLIKRKGKYGMFLGCSRFPRCRYTRDINVKPLQHEKGHVSRSH